MKSLQLSFNQDTLNLIKEYNTNQRFNQFLYKDKECNELFSHHSGLSKDRWVFVSRCNNIESELIPYIHDNFHGLQCQVVDSRGIKSSGIIVHNKARIYEGKTLDNTVSFRNSDIEGVETIAVWVDTMDKFTSHLYPADRVFIS